MTQLQETRNTICPYCILGLDPGSPASEVENQYRKLKEWFVEENFSDSPQSWVQGQQALLAIEDAYNQIVQAEDGAKDDSCGEDSKKEQLMPPKLGQLLVAAGKISLSDLEEALKKQITLDLPLGEILKAESLVTQMEIDKFLLEQRLIKLPPDSPHLTGQRLIGLGLVTDDMVQVALIEQRSSKVPIGRILVERGWLAPDILRALFNGEGD